MLKQKSLGQSHNGVLHLMTVKACVFVEGLMKHVEMSVDIFEAKKTHMHVDVYCCCYGPASPPRSSRTPTRQFNCNSLSLRPHARTSHVMYPRQKTNTAYPLSPLALSNECFLSFYTLLLLTDDTDEFTVTLSEYGPPFINLPSLHSASWPLFIGSHSLLSSCSALLHDSYQMPHLTRK